MTLTSQRIDAVRGAIARPVSASRWSAEEFDERFEAARSRLLAICRLVAGLDNADDLVQETYIRGSQRIGQLRDPKLFEAWLARIALNLARTHVRRQGRTEFGSAVPERALAGADSGLRDLVEQLPTRERVVVVLHYGYGYRLIEVAALMGISTINARTIAFRARRRLRKQMEEAERDEPIYELR